MIDSRLDELAYGWLDQALDTREQAEFEERLLASDEAQEHYLRLAAFHGFALEAVRLKWGTFPVPQADSLSDDMLASPASETLTEVRSAGGDSAPEDASSSQVLKFLHAAIGYVPGGEFTVGVLLLTIIVSAFAGLASLALKPPEKEPAIVGRPLDDEGPVRLTRTKRCRWGEASAWVGAPLTGKRLEVAAGMAELAFGRGARVVVEGPAVVEVMSASQVRLERGKLAAHVPRAAAGFTVVTPTAEVVDLGTRFVVDVTSAGGTELAVTQGAVDLRVRSVAGGRVNGGALGTIHVTAGQAMSVSRAGKTEVIARADGFDAAWTRQAAALDETDWQSDNQAIGRRDDRSPRTISVNLSGTAAATSLSPSDFAGVVSVGNWNNLSLIGATATAWTAADLADDSGTTTTASITTQNFVGTYDFGSYTPTSTADVKMLAAGGYVRGDAKLNVIDVSDIPYAAYDVYVYSNQTAVGRLSNFTIGSTTIPLASIAPYNPLPPYQEATAASSNGNYVHFSGLTGPSFSLWVQGLSGGADLNQSVISGLQIVERAPGARNGAAD